MLDEELLRDWLKTMVDPQIHYQMVIREERFRKDKSPASLREVVPYDDDLGSLEFRVRQFETGLRTMLDPPERLRRFVTNVAAGHTDNNAEFIALSYGMISRRRRLYEHEQFEFEREDILRKGADGKLRLLSRQITLDQRVVQGKNLLFLF